MNLREECAQALTHPNVPAFLRLIREGETGQTDSAYRELFGGSLFDAPPWEHPNKLISSGHYTSTAAGAYQFLHQTWTGCVNALGLEDFSPAHQDVAAVYLIHRRGVLDDLLAGDLDKTIAACGMEWASLPGSPYGQPTMTMAEARSTYAHWGGIHTAAMATGEVTPTPTPSPLPPEAPQMGAGLIVGLVQSLLGAFAPQAQAQLAPIVNALAPVVGGAAPVPPSGVAPASQDALLQFVQGIMTTALQVSGHPAPATATDADKIAATAKVLADPSLVAQVQVDTMSRLDKLGPTFDRLAAADAQANAASIEGKDHAAQRGLIDRWDMTKVLVCSSEFLAVYILTLGAGLIGFAIYKDKWEVAISILALVGAWVGSILKNRSQIYDYRLDGSQASNTANAINAQIASTK